MYVLTETTDILQIVLAGAITTNQLRCYASYRDITTSAYTPGRNAVNTNDTTDVDIVASPPSDTQRVIDTITVFNADNANATITIKLDVNGTDFELISVTLGPNERLEYVDGKGFSVYTSGGALKNSLNQGNNPVSSTINMAVLASDVVNANAVANTIADVTGLSFPVVAGHLYRFKFTILYASAATTTGSRWSINGPVQSRLIYMSEYSLASTSTTRNTNNISYDLPAASNATSGSLTSNMAIIEGLILPTDDGDVVARFASEILSSAITALAGSFVEYEQIT